MSFFKKLVEQLQRHSVFLTIAGILLATGAISIFSQNYIVDQNDQVIIENIKPTEKIRDLDKLMNQYRLKVYQQVASIEINESLKAGLPLIEIEINNALGKEHLLFLSQAQIIKFKKLQNYWLHLKKSYLEILELSDNYAKEEALEEISGRNQILSNNVTMVLSELVSLKLLEVENVNAKNHIIRLWSQIIIYATLILGVIISFVYISRYKNAIQDHISNLENRVEERTAALNTVCEVLEDKKILLEKLIILDPLTGIYNRRQCDDVLKREWYRACREKNLLAIVMIDVDYFKAYNDNYGHVAGDNTLRKVAETLKGCMKRPADFVCRYGGEEFLAILPDSSAENIEGVSEVFRNAIEQLQLIHEYSAVSAYVTVSIGMVVASLPSEEYNTAESLIKLADKMLYKAKKNGRNQVQLRIS